MDDSNQNWLVGQLICEFHDIRTKAKSQPADETLDPMLTALRNYRQNTLLSEEDRKYLSKELLGKE